MSWWTCSSRIGAICPLPFQMAGLSSRGDAPSPVASYLRSERARRLYGRDIIARSIPESPRAMAFRRRLTWIKDYPAGS